MLIRTAVLRIRDNKPDEIVILAKDILGENQEEAKITILMDNAIKLKDIPKKELVVVCSDFIKAK